jgi:hypothetical protein
MRSMPLRALCAALLLAVSAGGCRSINSEFWGALGYEKRDLLVSDVKKARDEQNKAKDEFKSALDQFKALAGASTDASLQAKYDKLKSAYDDADSRAKKVSKKITDVEYSAGQLFGEWEKELGQYSDAGLRRQSEQRLTETKTRYGQLVGAMRQAEAKMQPVLKVFNDQVLRLKHELNASAIASLQGTTSQVEQDVASLVADMERSINEANAFIAQLDKK